MHPINWHSFFFLLFCAAGLRVCAGGGVFQQHRADGVLSGACRWGRRPGLFFLAGADFVGAMQLMIYVGGTLVLLVFGVMLTAQGPFISMKTRGGEWILSALVGGSLLGGAGARRPSTSPTGRTPAVPSDCRDRCAPADGDATGPGTARRRSINSIEPATPLTATWRAICCRSKSCRCICWSC